MKAVVVRRANSDLVHLFADEADAWTWLSANRGARINALRNGGKVSFLDVDDSALSSAEEAEEVEDEDSVESTEEKSGWLNRVTQLTKS